MEETTLRKIEGIAWAKAHQILEEMGITKDDQGYGLMQYELQYKIYHATKEVLGLQTTESNLI